MQNLPINDWDFYVDPNNSLSLVMLRKVQSIDNIAHSTNKPFPNFILFNEDIEVAHMRKSALSSMIYQPTDPQIMIKQFCCLARRYFNSDQVYDFQIYFLNQKNPPNNVILKEYTKANFFHKFINNVLRNTKDPLELYYVQYFVKLLHIAIKAIYTDDIKKAKRRKFICYRGAILNDQQLFKMKQNKGKHIETLGFLSATVDQLIAYSFCKNIITPYQKSNQVMFQIEVDDFQRHQILDFGYAFLMNQSLSVNSYEKEVLFNALCSFHVQDFCWDSNHQVWHINLAYGKYSEIIQNYQSRKNISKNQLEILPIIIAQNSRLDCIQSNSLKFIPELKAQFILYLQTLLFLINSNPHQDKSIFKYLIIYELFSNYSGQQSAYKMELLQRYEIDVKQLENQSIESFSLQKLLIFLFKIRCVEMTKKGQGKYHQALQNSKKLRCIIPKIKKSNSNYIIQKIITHFQIVALIAQKQIQLAIANNRQQRAKYFQQFNKIKNRIIRKFGKNHQHYASILSFQYKISKQYPDLELKNYQIQNKISNIKVFPQGFSQIQAFYLINSLKENMIVAKDATGLNKISFEQIVKKFSKRLNNIDNKAASNRGTQLLLLSQLYFKMNATFELGKYIQCLECLNLIKNHRQIFRNQSQFQKYLQHFQSNIKRKQNQWEESYINSIGTDLNHLEKLSKTNSFKQEQFYYLQKCKNYENQIIEKLGKDSQCYYTNQILISIVLQSNGRYEEATQIYKGYKQNY